MNAISTLISSLLSYETWSKLSRNFVSFSCQLRLIRPSSRSIFGDCPVIEVPGRAYPVREFFLEDIIEELKFIPPPSMKKRKNEQDEEYKGVDKIEDDENCNKICDKARYSPNTAQSMGQLSERDLSLELMEEIFQAHQYTRDRWSHPSLPAWLESDLPRTSLPAESSRFLRLQIPPSASPLANSSWRPAKGLRTSTTRRDQNHLIHKHCRNVSHDWRCCLCSRLVQVEDENLHFSQQHDQLQHGVGIPFQLRAAQGTSRACSWRVLLSSLFTSSIPTHGRKYAGGNLPNATSRSWSDHQTT